MSPHSQWSASNSPGGYAPPPVPPRPQAYQGLSPQTPPPAGNAPWQPQPNYQPYRDAHTHSQQGSASGPLGGYPPSPTPSTHAYQRMSSQTSPSPGNTSWQPTGTSHAAAPVNKAMEKVLNAHLSVNGERGYAYLDGNGSRQSGTWQLNDRLYLHKLDEVMRANPDIDVATCTREIVSGSIHSFSFTAGNNNTPQRMHHPPELVQEIVNTLQGGVAQAMEMYRKATQGQLPPRSKMPQHGSSLRRTAHASITMERPEKRPIYFDGGVEFIGVNHYGRRDLGECRLEGGKLDGELYSNTLKNIMDFNPGIRDPEACTRMLVDKLKNSFYHKLGNGEKQVGFPQEAERSIVDLFKERVARDMEAFRR